MSVPGLNNRPPEPPGDLPDEALPVGRETLRQFFDILDAEMVKLGLSGELKQMREVRCDGHMTLEACLTIEGGGRLYGRFEAGDHNLMRSGIVAFCRSWKDAKSCSSVLDELSRLGQEL